MTARDGSRVRASPRSTSPSTAISTFVPGDSMVRIASPRGRRTVANAPEFCIDHAVADFRVSYATTVGATGGGSKGVSVPAASSASRRWISSDMS